MGKPSFTQEQMVKSSDAVKHFGEMRKRAKEQPILIMDNGRWDTVIFGYTQYEKLYQRLVDLEGRYEACLLESRIERLERHQESVVSWRRVKRSLGDE